MARTNLKAVHAYEDRFLRKDARRLLQLMLDRYPEPAAYFGIQTALKELITSEGIPAPAPDANTDKSTPIPPPANMAPAAPTAPSVPFRPAVSSDSLPPSPSLVPGAASLPLEESGR